MIASSNHRQKTWTHAELGQARAVRAPALSVVSLNDAKDRSAIRGRAGLISSQLGAGKARRLFLTRIGFAGSLDRFADDVVFDRAGALHRCRPQFIRTARHIRQDTSEPSETHDRGLPSPLVAVEANHRPKGFRVVRTAFREAGNVIRG